MWSVNMITNLSIYGMYNRFIKSMNIACILMRQNGITRNLKWLHLVLSFFFHIFICCLQLMITRTSHQVVEWVIYYWCPSCWAHGNLYTFSSCHPLWNNFCIVSSTPSFWLVLTSMEVSQSVLSLTSILF